MPFPLVQKVLSERPGAVKGAPLLGAAQRTLDGEDRSEMIAEEGKAGRKVGETWAAQMVPSPTASNSQKEGFGFGGGLNPRARPRGLARPVTLYESGWLASRPNATLPLSKALTELPIRSQLIDEMEVNRPNVSLGRCLLEPLSRTRRTRATGSRGFFGPPALPWTPDEPQYPADHRRRNPLYRKGIRCNYTFGTGTEKQILRSTAHCAVSRVPSTPRRGAGRDLQRVGGA